MVFRRDESTRTVHTPAKLNLYLNVFGRRDDGYHELETLMVPIGLWDSLSLVPAPPIRDDCRGEILLDVCMVPLAGSLHGEEEPVPIGDSNLVVRALQLLQQRSGCRAGACASLVKRIPAAAGLGGGSSDAAAALLLGNRVWRLGWTTERLAELGAELGSDVPFFIYRRAAICRGRGEHVTPLDGVARFHAVVVKPPFGLSTPAVFQAHDALRNHGDNVPGQRPLHGVVESLRRADYSGLGRWMTNQLEAAASTLTPWIREVRAVFDQLGCLGHQLSGSGSAYFGICPHAAEAHRVAAVLKAQQLGMVFVTRSCS